MTQQKQRRPKPVNYGKKRSLDLGPAEEAAVGELQKAMTRQRGKQVPWAEAARTLWTKNLESARALAEQPEMLAANAAGIDVPTELWNGLADCRNRLSHSQGSLYTVMRKLNFDEGITKDEVVAAFDAVQESKAAVARMEERLVEFVRSRED